MSSPGPIVRLAVPLLVIASFATSLGCGGSDTTYTGPVATFTPDVASPGDATVALLPAGGTGAAVSIRVAVTGVPGFFGTAFRVTYNPDFLLFTGWDYSSSFLLQGVASTDVFFLEDHLTYGGTVVVTATRLNPSTVPAIDVTTTSTLVVLNFTARQPMAVGIPEGRVEFGDPKQVCDGTVTPPGCGTIAVTWSGGGVSAH
jgi:hypothetical protein